uniref:Protein 10 (Fragments) n=1 Tax=Cavia porcellus TaxID=10141 RepID=PR10_CAVPO|nr:RecName: Full=Protein 10; AltName: Full=29 kDa brain-specific calcium-binding protein [Cavia porcellus]
EIWKHFDADENGYIEGKFMQKYDKNSDQHVGSSAEFMEAWRDMSRLLPVQENFLLKFQGMKLTSEEFNAIFTFYDKNEPAILEMNIQQLWNY